MTAFQKIYAPFDGVIGARNLAKATTGALIDLGSHDARDGSTGSIEWIPCGSTSRWPQNYRR